MSKAVPLGLRLFMEGVEIPVISAQVDIQPNSPATASIQIVPADSALALLPRTLVHLFYLDYAAFEEYSGDGEPTDQEKKQVEARPELNRFVAPDRYYKLLFSGQVIGINYAKTPVSRQMVLQCMDLSIYWDTCYQWFADYSVGGDALTDKSHNFVGAGHGLFDNVSSGTKWVIGNILSSKPLTPEYKDMGGLLGGLIHLLEVVGGIRWRDKDFPGYNGVTDFFTIGELRFNLLGMTGAAPEDKTSVQIYNSKAFYSWLRNGMSSLGNLMSFRDILNHVSQYIFHDIYPNPCGYYTEGKLGDAFITTEVSTTPYIATTTGGAIVKQLKDLYGRFAKAWAKFHATTMKGEPSSSTRRSNEVGYATEGVKLLRDTRPELRKVRALAETLKTDDKDVVVSSIDAIIDKVTSAYASDKQMYGSLLEAELDSETKTDEAMKMVRDLIGRKFRGATITKKKVQVKRGGHLFTQLVLPETYFLPAPRCNVIFPDQYYSLSYSRNFLREVSRLSLQGGMGVLGGGERGGGGAVIGHHYFAPNIIDAKGNSLLMTLQYGGRLLLPHEVHSGIIPKFEWVSQGHRWGVKAAKETGTTDALVKSSKIGYLQRVANFQFFLHRWSSRSMNVSSLFLPRLVLGLPAVVLDRAAPPPHVQAAIKKELGRELMPTQYLGKISGLSHVLNQETAQTTVALTHCRTHRAYDDEFLGVLLQEATKAANVVVFEIEPGKFRDLSPDKRKTYVWLLNQFLTRELRVGMPVPGYGGKVTSFKDEGQYRMDIQTASDYGLATHHFRDVGPQGLFVTVFPEKLTVKVQLSPGSSYVTSMAPEDVMMPGWYDTVWHKPNIGAKVYQPLLGVRAITDGEEQSSEDINNLLNRWAVDGTETNAAGESSAVTAENRVASFETVTGSTGTAIEVVTGSIEAAVDSLGIIYGMLKSEPGGDVHSFIERYTHRPIASMKDVMGSSNLEFNDKGEVTDPQTMFEGFHSRGFGDYNVGVDVVNGVEGKNAMKALFPGLAAADIPVFKRAAVIDESVRDGIKSYLDPRGRARARVFAYRAELQVSRGLLGG